MKKLVIVLIALSVSIGATKAQEKAFQKGKITISIGAGLGVYGTKYHEEKDSLLSNGTAYNGARIAKDKKDGAASGIFPITIEYGLRNWLGIAARFAYTKYISNDTTKNSTNPTVTAMDADLILNLHLIKTVRFDMPVQFTVGYSNFKFLVNDAKSTMAKANGISYGVALVPRIYFGKHIGMYFNLGYAGFNYPKLVTSDNTTSNFYDTATHNSSKLKADGVNLGLGLIVKLH